MTPNPDKGELLRCPFCDEDRATLDGKSDYCVVRCEHCGARSKSFWFDGEVQEEIDAAEADARQSWNTRAAAPPSPPVVTEGMVRIAVEAHESALGKCDVGIGFWTARRIRMKAALEAALSNRRAGHEPE